MRMELPDYDEYIQEGHPPIHPNYHGVFLAFPLYLFLSCNPSTTRDTAFGMNSSKPFPLSSCLIRSNKPSSTSCSEYLLTTSESSDSTHTGTVTGTPRTSLKTFVALPLLSIIS